MTKKLILDIDEETWKEVLKYKIDFDLANNNEAVVRLIKKGLKTKQIIDKNASVGAKRSKLKGLLNSISIAGSDNPLVEVEYKGKQSNVILTTQGESTLKIFG